MNLKGIKSSDYCFYKYVPNDPNLIVTGVFDHVSLVTTERKPGSETLHGAMSKLITEYVVMVLCKRYGLCACFIHQQEVYGDKQQFDNNGSTVVNKLLPSIDKLGDNKLVSRDRA